MAGNSFGISTSEMNVFTHRVIRPTAVDQIYKSATMLGMFSHKDRIKQEEGGSIQVQPLLVQTNETAMSYAGADPLNVDAQEEFSGYELGWKQANSAVTITGIDRSKNSGRAQALSFVKNKSESSLLALRNMIAGWVFGDGSGNNGKDFDGFAGAINTAAGFQVYLGLDRLSNPFWAAQNFDPGVVTALSTGNMMTLYMACKTDEEVPDVISTTKGGYTQYWGLLTPGERYVDDNLGNLGFSNIAFQGIPVVEDSHNPSGEMWFWNLDHCRFVVKADTNFIFIDFDEPINQDVQVAHWRVYGNFECRKPASCGRYRNIQGA